jgi:hypothetical protein
MGKKEKKNPLKIRKHRLETGHIKKTRLNALRVRFIG